MSGNILFEMQMEIMKRLPAKSLAVFRSVSKTWKSVIDSPVFKTDYTNLHQHHRLFISYDVDTFPDEKIESDFKYVSIMDNDSFPQHDTVTNVPVLVEQLYELELVGISQGLLCFFGSSRVDPPYDEGLFFGNSLDDPGYKETAVIWNPAIGKFIAIDVPYDELFLTVLGFGVRPDNCDPVIVIINDCAVSYPFRVMVFTLSSRVWRYPGGNPAPKSIGFQWSSTVATVDRCMYWKASGRSINRVFAFDMVSEDFTEIHLPNSVARRSFDNFSISKMKESLALLEYVDDAEKPVYDVWMMVEDGVSKSFTKLFTINTPDAPLETKVLGFRKNGQPIMETTIDEHGVSASLEVYEPRSGTIKKAGIDGEHDSFILASYTETLLLLDQLDGQLFVKIKLELSPPIYNRFKRIKRQGQDGLPS